ncbi:MAG: hypothetical protein QM740_06195 [Acidovorax sp.]
MNRITLAVVVVAALTTGCASRNLVTKSEFDTLYVGSPSVREHFEGELLKVDVVDDSGKVTLTDGVAMNLAASGSGILKGVGTAMNVVSFLAEKPQTAVYVLHLRDMEGKEITTSKLGPVSVRKFDKNDMYRILVADGGLFLFLNLTKHPELDGQTGPRITQSAVGSKKSEVNAASGNSKVEEKVEVSRDD